jgi:hypothetical protein
MAYHKVRFHGGNLRLLNPALFRNVQNNIGWDIGNKWVQIDLSSLDEDIRDQFVATLPLLSKMRNPDDAMAANQEYNNATIEMAKRQAEEEAKRKALEDSGHAQIAAYRKVGLLDTKRNGDIIREAIEKRDRGIFCSISVRNAVEGERSNLQWGKPEAAPVAAPAPAKPVEPQVRLSDGTLSLPLDKPIPGSASAEQCRDYLRRLRQRDGEIVVPGFKSALR